MRYMVLRHQETKLPLESAGKKSQEEGWLEDSLSTTPGGGVGLYENKKW